MKLADRMKRYEKTFSFQGEKVEKTKVYYYTYRVTCLITGKYYLGMHSSKRTPENDGYLGSGLWIKRSIRVYGKSNFKKELIGFYDTRKELARAEESLITEEQLMDPLCMNMTPGGLGNDLSKWISERLKSDPDLLRRAGIKGGIQSWKRNKEKMDLNPEYKQQVLLNLARGRLAFQDRYAGDPEYRVRIDQLRKNSAKNLSQYSYANGLVAGRERKRRMKEDAEFNERMTKIFRKNADRYSHRFQDDPAFRKQVLSTLEKARMKRKEKEENDPEFKKRLASAKGSRWISNQELGISMLVKDVSSFLQNGWIFGRIYVPKKYGPDRGSV